MGDKTQNVPFEVPMYVTTAAVGGEQTWRKIIKNGRLPGVTRKMVTFVLATAFVFQALLF